MKFFIKFLPTGEIDFSIALVYTPDQCRAWRWRAVPQGLHCSGVHYAQLSLLLSYCGDIGSSPLSWLGGS